MFGGQHQVAGDGEVGSGAGGDTVDGAQDRKLERPDGADDRVVGCTHRRAEVDHASSA